MMVYFDVVCPLQQDDTWQNSLAVVLVMPKGCKTAFASLGSCAHSGCWLLAVKQYSADHCDAMKHGPTFQPQASEQNKLPSYPTNKDRAK